MLKIAFFSYISFFKRLIIKNHHFNMYHVCTINAISTMVFAIYGLFL